MSKEQDNKIKERIIDYLKDWQDDIIAMGNKEITYMDSPWLMANRIMEALSDKQEVSGSFITSEFMDKLSDKLTEDQKQERPVSERIIKECLDYCSHRIKKHNKFIPKYLDRIDELRKEEGPKKIAEEIKEAREEIEKICPNCVHYGLFMGREGWASSKPLPCSICFRNRLPLNDMFIPS